MENNGKKTKLDAFNMTVRLYALKLANYAVIQEATNTAWHIDNMSEYDAPKVGSVNLFRRIHNKIPKYQGYCDELELQVISSEYFLEPTLHQVQDPKSYNARNIVSDYQWNMVKLFQTAQKTKIIDEKFNILDMKRFKNDFLEKCVLPVSLPDPDHMNTMNYPEYPNVFLFHSLTDVGIVHLIKEQIGQVFNEPVYKNPVYQDGKIHDADTLRNALEKLHYRRFTNDAEIAAAVGTNGLNLAHQIANRMTERVKK